MGFRSAKSSSQLVDTEGTHLTAWDIPLELIRRMSKSHVRELVNVYAALARDTVYAYPTLESEIERDLIRLQVLVEQRGIHLFLVDLPAVAKHLDRCLASGHYNVSGLPLTKRKSPTVLTPKFLGGLYLMVFHEDGRLKEDCDVQAVFFLRQWLLLAKKTKWACSPAKVRQEIVAFAEIDKSLPEPSGFWSSFSSFYESASDAFQHRLQRSETEHDLSAGHPMPQPGGRDDGRHVTRRTGVHALPDSRSLLVVFDSVSDIITCALGSYRAVEWRFRHGPGAVEHPVGPHNKYSWDIWPDSLERIFPIADFGYHNYGAWSRWVRSGSQSRALRKLGCGRREPAPRNIHPNPGNGERAVCSRMVAVPKTFKGPRLIAAEPASQQFCQQNIWHYFRERSTNSWINLFLRFNDQGKNQRLCKEGSLGGRLATVDLSAASDRVTCDVVFRFFGSNPNLVEALRAVRTPRVRQTLTTQVEEVIELRKFSTMGNACTFPVESLIFLGAALASVLHVRKLRPTLANICSLAEEVAVFGDDVIVPEDSRESFVQLLELLWFKINADKSFWTGRFRESCGVDAFRGVDVTPAYYREPYDGKPASLASVVEVSNNFYQKFLVNVSSYLASTLPRDLPEVAMRSGVLGLKTFCQSENTHLPVRYNSDLQRVEYRAITLASVSPRTPTNDDSSLLQYFTEDPSPHDQWEHGIAGRPLLKARKRWVSLTDLVARPDELERELVLLRSKASSAS